MQDTMRAYLELALGLTEASKKKATKIAKKLVAESGAKAGQAQSVAEELIATSLANREAVGKLVRYELDRALGRVGLATAEEVAELTERVQDLEAKLRAAEARGGSEARTVAPAAPAAAKAAPVAKKAVAKKSVAKKTVAKKAAAAGDAAAKVAVDVAPAAAKATVAKAAPAAKKAAAKKTVAKKAAAKPAAND